MRTGRPPAIAGCLVALMALGAAADELAASAASTTSRAEDVLRVIRSIGINDEQLVLHRPIDISWAANGDAYVLNEGDGSISVFSKGWKFRKSFSRHGEAPGELINPSGLVVLSDEVWVKTPRGAVVFDLLGNYLRLQRIPHQVRTLSMTPEGMYGTATYAEGVVVRVAPDGDLCLIDDGGSALYICENPRVP